VLSVKKGGDNSVKRSLQTASMQNIAKTKVKAPGGENVDKFSPEGEGQGEGGVQQVVSKNW